MEPNGNRHYSVDSCPSLNSGHRPLLARSIIQSGEILVKYYEELDLVMEPIKRKQLDGRIT